MAKNPKKPTNLSMGGVMPRRPRSRFRTTNISLPGLSRPIVKQKAKPQKPQTKKRFSFKGLLTFIKEKIYYLLIPAYILALYSFRLLSLPPTGTDGSLSMSHNNLTDIYSIDFLPVKLAVITSDKLTVSNPLDIRVLSMFLFLVSLFCFYKLTASWLGKRVAVIALLLYASSSWSIALVRHDSEFIMLAAFIPILLYVGGLLISTGSTLVRIICSVILVQFVFIPGGVWFIAASLVAAFGRSDAQLKLKQLILPFISAVLVLVAYGFLLFKLSLTGLPQLFRLLGLQIGELPSSGTIKANVLGLPNELFFSGVNDSTLWLQGTPIIDWLSAIFLIVGLVYLASLKYRSKRTRYLIFLVVLSLLFISINGFYYISLLLPLVYIVAAIGIKYLKRQWLSIFPNNPLAGYFGIVLIFAAVFMASAYHVERYFIGWPKTEKYQQIFKS